MKKLKLLLVAALVLVVPFFAFVSTAYAGSFRSGDNAVVKKGEVVDHSLFIAGNNVEINGEINGDVHCAGQNITVNAKVTGDVICAGMNVRVGGTVEGDVRLAGQNVTLSANVSRNASLFGSTVLTEEVSTVGRDLQVAGSMTTLNGQIGRDVDVAGDNVTLNSMVGRDVSAASENLNLGDAANVAGNIDYTSKNKLQQSSSAQVAGKVTQKEPQMQDRDQNPAQSAFAGTAMFFLMLLVLAMALVALFPRVLGSISNNAIEKPGATVLIGLAACILMPVLIVGSFVTVVGIFLGAVLLLAWLVLLMLSFSFFSFYIGRLALSRTNQHPLLAMFVGVLIMAILSLIPVVNVLSYIAATLFGTGMVVRELLRRTPKPAYEAAPRTVKAKKK